MSFAGHVYDMINRIKYNDSIRASKKPKYHEGKTVKTTNYSTHEPFELKVPAISSKELEQLKQSIRESSTKERHIKNTVAVILFTLTGALIIGFIVKHLLL